MTCKTQTLPVYQVLIGCRPTLPRLTFTQQHESDHGCDQMMSGTVCTCDQYLVETVQVRRRDEGAIGKGLHGVCQAAVCLCAQVWQQCTCG